MCLKLGARERETGGRVLGVRSTETVTKAMTREVFILRRALSEQSRGPRKAPRPENKGGRKALSTLRGGTPPFVLQASTSGWGLLPSGTPCPAWRISLPCPCSRSVWKLRDLQPCYCYFFSKSVHPRPRQVQYSEPSVWRREAGKV